MPHLHRLLGLAALLVTSLALPATAQIAPPPAPYGEVVLNNACSQPVQVYLRHKAQSGWQASGWHNVPPKAGLVLSTVQHKVNENLYYYAETTAGPPRKWQGSAYKATHQGRSLNLARAYPKEDARERTFLDLCNR